MKLSYVLNALKELALVLAAWVTGKGSLAGLLIAWLEVVSGSVVD